MVFISLSQLWVTLLCSQGPSLCPVWKNVMFVADCSPMPCFSEHESLCLCSLFWSEITHQPFMNLFNVVTVTPLKLCF